MICAGETGIFELDPDGTQRRRLTPANDAKSPRYLPGRRSIVFVSGGNTLRRLDLDTGEDTAIAGPWSATVPCGTSELVPIEIQADDDVVLDESGQYLCIALYDRNVNMASAGASVRISLPDGTVQWRPTLVPEHCAGQDVRAPFICHAAARAAVVTDDFPYSFDDTSFAIVGPSGHQLGKLSDFVSELTAPGGRWLLLSGNQEDGDYIHRNLMILDRLTGLVTPVPVPGVGPGPQWPAPLDTAELSDPKREKLDDRAGDVVGETPVRFVGPDRLVVGNLLLLLELQRIAKLPGDLAR